MSIRTQRGLRVAFIGLAATTALALAGCETGKIGEVSIFDASVAEPDTIAKALNNDGRVTLRGVLFETDSARLNDSGRDAAARLAGAMLQNPTIRVAIVGNTDSTGAFRYNLDLSQRRAQAMADELIRVHGVSADRIAPVGVGEIAPVASNDTPEGRAQNRRVDVVLIE